MVRISGRTQPLDRYPTLEALQVIKRLGLEGVEVCLETAEMAPDALTDEAIAAAEGR